MASSRHSGHVRLFTALAALLAVSLAGGCHASAALTQRAESALRERLRTAFPSVTKFRIDPLPMQWQASAWLERERVPHPTLLVTRLGAQSAVWVGTSPASGALRGALLWFKVAGYAPAVVSTHLLESGTALEAGDGQVALRDIVAAACQPLTRPAQLAGMRALRLVPAGELICAGAVEPMPPVVRGEPVTVRFAGSAVSVTAQVIAQSDGVIGAPVLVRNLDGGPLYSATVVGKAQVSVSE
jgi:flagella basal body P-ring formation protein FlgA